MTRRTVVRTLGTRHQRRSRALASEPADVLIIGAGASGGVVALRLAEAGFTVVCLEQGEWVNRADYPGNKLDWELKARKDWATSPNVRGLASDYPIVEDDTPVSPLMYNAVGGSTIIFAGAWPRALPSDFRVRTLDGIADDWPIDYFELLPYFYRTDRQFGISGLPGDPAYPPDTEDAPMPPLPIGAAGLRVARGMTKLGWHWWPEFNSINSTAYDGRRACVQRSTCQSGCNEGAKASTDLTHWPKAIGLGARLVTGARVSRIETNEKGLATGATWIDGEGVEHRQEASVVVLAANAIGTPRLLLLSATKDHPDGLANRSGLVGKRLMMHPGTSSRASSSTRRTSGGGSSAVPAGASRRPAVRSTPRCRAAPASRSGARTTTSTCGRTWATVPTGGCSPRTSPTRQTTSRCPRR
jgi:choline dehydrogenase-like flavoprotein